MKKFILNFTILISAFVLTLYLTDTFCDKGDSTKQINLEESQNNFPSKSFFCYVSGLPSKNADEEYSYNHCSSCMIGVYKLHEDGKEKCSHCENKNPNLNSKSLSLNTKTR
jgi:hypothetical protein